MRSLAVVYLSRARNGLAPLQAVLESYDTHSAGRDHDLVILMKGYDDSGTRTEHLRLMDHRKWIAVDVPDSGFDIGSYQGAARSLPHDLLVFLNSYSKIRTEQWLAKLCGPLADTGVGMAGATGSWESIYRNWRLTTRWGGWRHPVQWIRMRTNFPGFPNPHLRSNSFLIKRETFLALEIPPLVAKEDAWRVESGRNSLTRQIWRKGLKTVIVGADGRSYEPPHWPQARVFRSGDQENLIVADNQTELFAGADAKKAPTVDELCVG